MMVLPEIAALVRTDRSSIAAVDILVWGVTADDRIL